MTEGIIQEILAPWKKEFPYYMSQLEQELISRIRQKAHWMYPEYSNERYDILSLTAHELAGDWTK